MHWISGNNVASPTAEYHYSVQTKNGLKQIDIRDIYFISKHDRKTLIQTKEEQLDTSSSLSDMVKSLPKSLFLRVHKSYIVNASKIKELKYHAGGYYHAYFKDFGKTYVTVSKNRINELRNALNLI